MRSRLSLILALVAATAACASGPRHFEVSDMPKIVLGAEDAPVGTELDTASSGPQSLDELAGNRPEYHAKLRSAGFRASYFHTFLSRAFLGKGGEITEGGVIAISYAVLFESAPKASEGLRVIEENVREQAVGVRDVPLGGLGEEGFAVEGDIRPRRPPGYHFAWRIGNGVFGFIATGPRGKISDDATRLLAERMEQRARRIG